MYILLELSAYDNPSKYTNKRKKKNIISIYFEKLSICFLNEYLFYFQGEKV
jgi:hypothetical protein